MKQNKIEKYIFLGVLVLLVIGCAANKNFRSNVFQPIEASNASKIIVFEAVPKSDSYNAYKFIDDSEISGIQITGASRLNYKAYTPHGIVPKMLKYGEMADSYFIFFDADKIAEMNEYPSQIRQTSWYKKERTGHKYFNPVELEDIVGEYESNKIKSEILKEQKKETSVDDPNQIPLVGFEPTKLKEYEYQLRKGKIYIKRYAPTFENNELLLKPTEEEKSLTAWVVLIPERLIIDASNNYHALRSKFTYRKGHMDPNAWGVSTVFFFKNACYGHVYDVYQYNSKGEFIGHKFLSGQDTECLTRKQLRNIDVVYNTAKYDFMDWLKANIKMKKQQ